MNASLALLTEKWRRLSDGAEVIVVTDRAQKDLAEKIADSMANRCSVVLFERSRRVMSKLKKLRAHDLVVAVFSLDFYLREGANCFFSPFEKPAGVSAQYIFIRLGISEASLLEGLATPKELICEKVSALRKYAPGSRLRVTNAAGTDITLTVGGFDAFDVDDVMFLPPSEVSSEVLAEAPGKADGKIAVDVTVGQLYYYGKLLGQFGLVTEPVVLTVENGLVTDITGGDMARDLKEKLFALPPACRELVELGHGLSQMTPTGLIGVDESIISTCHFGIGDGAGCGVHLDVVIDEPTIEVLGIRCQGSGDSRFATNN